MAESVLEALHQGSTKPTHEASLVQIPLLLFGNTTQHEAEHQAPEVHPVPTDDRALGTGSPPCTHG